MLNFPFKEGTFDGFITHMISSGDMGKVFAVSSSVLTGYQQSNALDLNLATYFCSAELCDNSSNSFTLILTNHTFSPDGYSIRSHNHQNYYYLRSWKLEGSLDFVDWKLLHSILDVDILSGGSIASFSLSGGPFRYFRITQIGESKGETDADRCRLRISAIDFFGMLKPLSLELSSCYYNKYFTYLHAADLFSFILIG